MPEIDRFAINAAMKKKNMTADEVAERAIVEITELQKYLQGETKRLDKSILSSVCHVLGLHPEIKLVKKPLL